VAYSPDGKRLASASSDRTVKVWDAGSGQEVLTLTGHTGTVCMVAFSPDGKRLASAGGDGANPGEVKVWDAGSGQQILSLMGYASMVYSVVFSRDGKCLASADGDWTVKVWDSGSGQEILSLKEAGFIVAFSPDGKRFASVGRFEVKVWDTDSGQEIFTLKGHRDRVASVAFNPDGQRLASAGEDGTVKLWDTSNGHEILSLQGHTDQVTSVAFSPDGKRLASACGPKGRQHCGEVRVWDARSLTEDQNEAEFLLRGLVAKHMNQAEILTRLRQDGTISEPVRRIALSMLER
jgi:WD40 repeat protein